MTLKKLLEKPQFVNILKALAAAFVFTFLIYWFLKPVVPIMNQKVPAFCDMGNNTANYSQQPDRL